MSFTSAMHGKAVELCKLAVEMTTAAGSGHPSSAMSLAHIVAILMYHQMRWDPKDPWNPNADKLVLSEGHAVPIIYAAYTDLGGMIGRNREEAHPMTREDAMNLRSIYSIIDGHPNPRLGFPFFDAATGSLGQGLSAAAGLGAAAKMEKNIRNIYCLIGDGESREGQIWEACDFLIDHALTNIIPIFNCNELGQSDWVSPQQSHENMAKKLEAFGFIVRNIDGHDPEQLRRSFDELPVIQNGSKPLAIVARTVKGWGAHDEQGMGKHGNPVKKEKMAAVLRELDETAASLGINTQEVIRNPNIENRNKSKIQNLKSEIAIPPIDESMEKMGFGQIIHDGKSLATRKAYGVALVALGEVDDRIVGLDGDVKNSTYSEWFARRFPDRYLECRIAEQNMVSVAAGLAAGGKIPFCSTFAKFFERAYDQLEMAIISGANIKLTGSHAGVTLAADGPSQMSLPDVAFIRSFCHVENYDGEPAARYFFPADAVSAYRCMELMANLNGCCYQRTLRADLPIIYPHEERFEVGGFKVLREGKDLVLVSAGYMVHECLKVADELAHHGRHACVIDAYSLPLKSHEILEIAMRSGGLIVTVEDNYSGGLDAELAIAITQQAADIQLLPLRVRHLPKSGREPQDVLDYLNLGVGAILSAIAMVDRHEAGAAAM